MTCLRRLTALALLVLALAVWWPTALAGHAELLRTEPTAGAVLPSAPAQVHLWFSEPVDPPLDAVVVIGPDGVRVDRRDSRVVPGDEGAIDVTLGAQAQGTYVVRWRAISADSHPINGEFQFSVGQPSTIASVESPISAPPRADGVPLQASARWLHLIGLTLLIGPLTLGLLVVSPSPLPGIDVSLWRASRWGGWLLVLATFVSLTAQAAAVAGSVADGLQSVALHGLLQTRWGALWTLRVALAVLVVAMTHVAARRQARARSRRWWLWPTLLVSAGLIVVTAMNSHSAATSPVWLSVGVDWVHIAATTIWIGGLFGLTAIVLPGSNELAIESRQALLAPIVSRFSIVAMVSVELLVLSGLYHTWAHVSDPGALVSTSYGRVLLVKLLLVVAMLLPAAFNLLKVRPLLARSREPMNDRERRRFTWSVRTEAVLGVFVLAAVGLLTSLPPAQSVSVVPPSPPSSVNEPNVTLVAPAGRLLVTLVLGPGRVGSNHVDVRVQDERGASLIDAQVKLRIVPPDASQISSWVVAPAARGEHREATVALAPEGRWGLNVEVTTDADALSTASFSLTVPLRGAGELLAAATDRMNALRSVTEETEMVMGGVTSTERSEHRAPLNYRWLESATDVALLGREPIDGDECFVIAYVDTRDGSRVRIWINTGSLYVARLISAVPGHVHTSRFSAFNSVGRTAPRSVAR